jgi:hypothetical protein
VQAISKWLLLPGTILLLGLALMLHSTLLLIISVIAGIAVFKQLFSQQIPTGDEPIAATPVQKFVIGFAYVSLAGMLAYLYVLSLTTIPDIHALRH